MRTESRERGPALLTCAQTRKAAPVADVRTGETTCFVEKSYLMCALALVLFLLTRAPGRGQCIGLHAGKIPCKHRSAKQHRCRRSLAEKQLSFTRRSLESHVRAGSRPVLPARAQTGLQLLVQFPVTTVHTCRLLRNVQQVLVLTCVNHRRVHVSSKNTMCRGIVYIYSHMTAQPTLQMCVR